MDANLALQTAIYTALTGDAALTALIGAGRVFDHVPENQTMPYVVIEIPATDEWDVTPYDASNGIGKEHDLQIHEWSDYEGKKQIYEMQEAVFNALHDQAFALTDHNLVNIRFETGVAERDPDGQAMHGVSIFRAVTEQD